MKHSFYILVVLIFLGCKEHQDAKILSVNSIVDKSIDISGGDHFGQSNIEFKFRDKRYRASRYKGDFALSRAFALNNDSVFDVLTNKDFTRFIEGEVVDIPDSMKFNYAASVNSVHYFSILPYGLNDKAVHKELMEPVSIKGEPYYKVRVTFDEKGGGEDFEDVFIYWIHKNTYKVDYLAYSYNESDGKGLRFREAYNERYVNGLRFVDYNNYKPLSEDVALFEMDELFEKERLKLLSKIELESISVDLIKDK